MGRPKELAKSVKFDFEAFKMAREMGCRVKRDPLYVDIKTKHYPIHWIHVGYDEGWGYFVTTSIGGSRGMYEPLWDKRGLSKQEANRVILQALAGRDISVAIRKRLGD